MIQTYFRLFLKSEIGIYYYYYNLQVGDKLSLSITGMINGSSVTARNEVYIVITEAIHSVPIVPSVPVLPSVPVVPSVPFVPSVPSTYSIKVIEFLQALKVITEDNESNGAVGMTSPIHSTTWTVKS